MNKSPSESMSFITEVICKFIFTDVHMRNNYHPNRAYNILWLKFLNGSVKNTFFTLTKSALFSASRFLVHVALNANELCSPRPSLPWSDEQTLNFSQTLLGKVICKDLYKKKKHILTSSVDKAGSRMIRANIDAFRQIGDQRIPFKAKVMLILCVFSGSDVRSK